MNKGVNKVIRVGAAPLECERCRRAFAGVGFITELIFYWDKCLLICRSCLN